MNPKHEKYIDKKVEDYIFKTRQQDGFCLAISGLFSGFH